MRAKVIKPKDMTEKKEITIKKTSINKFLKDLVVAFLISIPILLVVQHMETKQRYKYYKFEYG